MNRRHFITTLLGAAAASVVPAPPKLAGMTMGVDMAKSGTKDQTRCYNLLKGYKGSDMNSDIFFFPYMPLFVTSRLDDQVEALLIP